VHGNGGSRIELSGWRFAKLEEEANRIVATLLWPSVGAKPNTWKSWDLESSGTPECLELNNKGKNTSHWGVLGVIEKVLKRKYRK
jgi:hypothetical protein